MTSHSHAETLQEHLKSIILARDREAIQAALEAGARIDTLSVNIVTQMALADPAGIYNRESNDDVAVVQYLFDQGLPRDQESIEDVLDYSCEHLLEMPRIEKILYDELKNILFRQYKPSLFLAPPEQVQGISTSSLSIIANDLADMDIAEQKNKRMERREAIKKFNRFKKAYDRQYQAEFFKNSNSSMKKKLDSGEINSWEAVKQYVEDHPNSRSYYVFHKQQSFFSKCRILAETIAHEFGEAIAEAARSGALSGYGW